MCVADSIMCYKMSLKLYKTSAFPRLLCAIMIPVTTAGGLLSATSSFIDGSYALPMFSRASNPSSMLSVPTEIVATGSS